MSEKVVDNDINICTSIRNKLKVNGRKIQFTEPVRKIYFRASLINNI